MQEEHNERLEKCSSDCKRVTLNSEKCRFAQKSVKFLGHCIDGTGIRPDPEKVMAIQKVKVPTNVGDVPLSGNGKSHGKVLS